jgi:aminoglycoside phosphotransferase (APT) family kinase protein
MATRHSAEVIARLREEARPRFRRYVDERLLPLLKSEGPVTLRPVTRGLGSLLFYLDAPSSPPLVLRGASRRRGLRRRVRGHRLLLDHGVTVPEIVHVDLDPRTRLRWGWYFALETRLPGVPIDEYESSGERGSAAAAAAGGPFARIHSVSGPRRGPPGTIRTPRSSLPGWLRGKTRSWLRRYARRGGPDVGRLADFIVHAGDDWRRQTPRLCMGDIAPNNVLFDGERIGLVDLAGVTYHSAPLELVRIRYKLLEGRESLWTAFYPEYLKAASASLRNEVETSLPTLEVLYYAREYGRTRDPQRGEFFLGRLRRVLGD